ncbi:MAG: RNA polymerase sigma factor RpoH [Arenicellales bacterium]|jgi:RNA polymerase sigma-32 factor|nr:RNA polymerase sigma factor RpoH [Acidiferrobacteraceae bacterium]MDP6289971.1 RNA polymerase sigma factor RpoH [Arenicellales bacterium]MDP6434215.1 RNA polymerase sigma factor RpoH [Arenicellales bacterium]MDP6672315.1 RNA polymerase sigma factor RpoH [Arenicellales bacterium]MDP6723991.1 RNA polymerase sigma factor RpoH [Arenicellales bacterium]|tara:strand:+ start:92 stop:961 length:870 start_codon:yes stop_codon:yes gene_type:complete
MSSALTLPLDLTAGAGLSSYLRTVNGAPLLTVEEEQELARRYFSENDLEAARQLVFSHLRYVVRVARGFKGYGLPLADLIQEGNIGLMKAVKRFDPDRDVRLVSFAIHWIRSEIYDYVIRNWRIVKVATTKAQRKLFFNLRKSRSRLGWLKPEEVEELAENLSVKEETVREMESRLGAVDLSFDLPVDEDREHRPPTPEEMLGDRQNDPAYLYAQVDSENQRQSQLSQALATLDERSRRIVTRRWLQEDEAKSTLHELAAEYGVSAERIRQIEKRALSDLRNVIESVPA